MWYRSFKNFRTTAVVFLLVLSPLVSAEDKRPVTFEDILALKTVGAPRISPDGESIVYSVTAWEEQDEMALGYALSGGWYRVTPNPRSFGYPGLGGHMAFGDPDAALGFGYVANQMKIPADFGDPRVARILDALDTCIR